MRLFIIGNGFDTGMHNMDGKYSDFKKYLKKHNEFKDLLDELNDIFDEYKLFSDFERALGEIKPNSIVLLNKIGYEGIFESVIDDLKKAFAKWTVEINTSLNKIKKLDFDFNENDLFLSFNYTLTLEEVYKIDSSKICHIHGCCWETLFGDDDSIVFGHAKISPTGDKGIDKLIKLTEKKTNECLQKEKTFFESLNNIDEIVSLGFSFGEVDDLYIKTILKKINNNTKWYLSHYEFEEDFEHKKKRLEENGFKGEINQYFL